MDENELEEYEDRASDLADYSHGETPAQNY